MANPKALPTTPSGAPVAPAGPPVAHPAPAVPGHTMSSDASDLKCEDYLPSFVCNPHMPEIPGAADIPWWVWAIGGVGTVSFATLAYASFKAAPYVMPIVNPDAAPLAKAWLRHRAGHDKADIAHEALTALREQRSRAPRTKEELQDLREAAIKEMVADMLAKRRMKQLAKTT